MDTAQTKNTKRGLPPYLNVAKLRILTEKITNTSPKTITTTTLKDDYGATDASIAMGALRFLGIIDENDAVITDVIKKFQQRDAELRNKELQGVMRTAYRDLFEYVVGNEPQVLTADKLQSAMQNVYSVTPRIAEPAARAFLFLCEESGLKERSATKPRVPSPRTKKENQQKSTAKSASEKKVATPSSDMTAISFGNDITLTLPTVLLTDTDRIEAYKTVANTIKTFANESARLLPKDNSMQDD